MHKPELSKSGLLNYYDAVNYLQAKYEFNIFNYLEAGQIDPRHHYDAWCDAKGYTKDWKDSGGVGRSESRIPNQEYSRDPQGEVACPEVQNFWHWLLSFMSPPGCFKIPSSFKLNIAEILAEYDAKVAPANAEKVANVVAGMSEIMRFLPSEFHATAVRHVSQMEIKLPTYVRTILGYFQAEFGPKVKLQFPKDAY